MSEQNVELVHAILDNYNRDLWSIRDGAVVRVTLDQEREEALEAAGLSG